MAGAARRRGSRQPSRYQERVQKGGEATAAIRREGTTEFTCDPFFSHQDESDRRAAPHRVGTVVDRFQSSGRGLETRNNGEPGKRGGPFL